MRAESNVGLFPIINTIDDIVILAQQSGKPSRKRAIVFSQQNAHGRELSKGRFCQVFSGVDGQVSFWLCLAIPVPDKGSDQTDADNCCQQQQQSGLLKPGDGGHCKSEHDTDDGDFPSAGMNSSKNCPKRQ
jgi:hypothetical protein